MFTFSHRPQLSCFNLTNRINVRCTYSLIAIFMISDTVIYTLFFVPKMIWNFSFGSPIERKLEKLLKSVNYNGANGIFWFRIVSEQHNVRTLIQITYKKGIVTASIMFADEEKIDEMSSSSHPSTQYSHL